MVLRGQCRAKNQLKTIAKIIDTAMPLGSSPSDEVIGEYTLLLLFVFLVRHYKSHLKLDIATPIFTGQVLECQRRVSHMFFRHKSRQGTIYLVCNPALNVDFHFLPFPSTPHVIPYFHVRELNLRKFSDFHGGKSRLDSPPLTTSTTTCRCRRQSASTPSRAACQSRAGNPARTAGHRSQRTRPNEISSGHHLTT